MSPTPRVSRRTLLSVLAGSLSFAAGCTGNSSGSTDETSTSSTKDTSRDHTPTDTGDDYDTVHNHYRVATVRPAEYADAAEDDEQPCLPRSRIPNYRNDSTANRSSNS